MERVRFCEPYSDSEEEFNDLEPLETEERVMSSEILVSIPIIVGSKKFQTYLALGDSGTSGLG